MNTWENVVVTENFHKGEAAFRPTFGSRGNQNLRASLLLGQWTREECAWANPKGLGSLESQLSFPLKHHTNSPPWLIFPGPQYTAEGARRLHSEEQGLSWDPQHQERLRLAEPCSQIPWGLDATRDSGPSQKVGESRPLEGSTKGTLPGCVRHPQFSSGTQACLGSRDVIASQVREVGEKKIGAAFPSFSYRLVDAAVHYTWFAVLWCQRTSWKAHVLMGWDLSLPFFFFLP